MKALWASAWGVLLGCSAASAGAGEYAWQPATAQAAPAVAARPLGVSLGRPAPLGSAVSLSRPVVGDPGIIQTSYSSPLGALGRPIVRLQSPDSGLPAAPTPSWSRMPSGPSGGFAAPAPPVAGGAGTFAATGPVHSQPLTGFACGDGACDDSACCDDPCGMICPDAKCCPCPTSGHRWYGSTEYLLWWISDSHYPPLVTAGNIAQPIPGAIGEPGTTVLYGGNSVNNGPLSGLRFRMGYWFDECETCGLDGSFFFLGPRSTNFLASSSAYPVLGRPFYDVNHQQQSAETVTDPRGAFGSVMVNSSSFLWGGDLNFRRNLCCGCAWRIDGLAGARYLNLSENLDVLEQVHVVPGPLAGQNTGLDSFITQNQFYGGQAGFIAEYRRNRWVVDLRATLAAGDTYSSVQVAGGQTLLPANGGPVQHFPGGLLALPSNEGLRTGNRFSLVPEVGINLGYQMTENLKLFVGYNFLYWTGVVRPGDQINRNLNVNQIPHFPAGPTAPLLPYQPFNATNFWAQGVNIGLQLRY